MSRTALGLAAALLATPALADGPPAVTTPRLFVAFPPGVRAGTAVEVTLAGQDLDEPQALVFSHPGLRAEPVPEPPPPPPDPKKKQATPPAAPAPLKYKVTADPGLPAGLYDVRLVTRFGVTNPRAFAVGELPEAVEREPNDNGESGSAQRVELNSTVSGAVGTPVDVDYYAFAGKRGQRVVVGLVVSSIDSRARPALEVYDAHGARLAFNRLYDGFDCLTDVVLPEDGDYFVRVFEFAHTAGSAEHFYRLSVSTGPWIDAAVPPAVEPGKPTQVTLYGRNLPGGTPDPTALIDGRPLDKLTVTVTPPADPLALTYSGRVPAARAALDGFEYRLPGSNPVLLTFARDPVVPEAAGNDRAESAQAIPTPCEVAGRVERRGDRDWYAFTARKGDVFTVELLGERLGSPTDLYFGVRAAGAAKWLAEEVDDPATADVLNPQQFFNRTADPQPFRFAAPADGRYEVFVGARDSGNQFGPRQGYRLRVAPERPDFRLFVTSADPKSPDAPCLRPGASTPLDVFLLRTEGFTGPVTLSVDGLPAGVTCPPQVVGTGLKQGALVLHTADGAKPWAGVVTVKGTAAVNGRTVVRAARSATITWPHPQPTGNATALPTRLERAFWLAVRDRADFRLTAGVTEATVKLGDKLTVPLKLERLDPAFKLPVDVLPYTPTGGQNQNAQNSPPVALPANSVTFNNGQKLTVGDKSEASAVLDVKQNATPGTYSLVLRGVAAVPAVKDGKRNRPAATLVQAAQPVTVKILPNAVANLSVGTAPTLKPGGTAELAVKLERLHGYDGPFTVQLVIADGAKGVSAADVTVPAGVGEAKLVLTAAADAPLGTAARATVRATATLDGTVLEHVTKQPFNVRVVK